MSRSVPNPNAFTYFDTLIRMIVCKDDHDACLSVRHDSPSSGPVCKFIFKDVAATAINSQCVHFKCPLNSQLCTNYHIAAISERKLGSVQQAKVEHVIDTEVIFGCLDRALQRGAWDELFNFVSAGAFRGLRIVVKPETIIDDDDGEPENHCVPVETKLDQKAKTLVSSLLMKGEDHLFTSKVPASVRRAAEHHRSKAAQEAHIALAVMGQMVRYQKFLDQSNPFAQTNSKSTR